MIVCLFEDKFSDEKLGRCNGGGYPMVVDWWYTVEEMGEGLRRVMLQRAWGVWFKRENKKMKNNRRKNSQRWTQVLIDNTHWNTKPAYKNPNQILQKPTDMAGSAATDRGKEAIGMMALHETFRNLCINSDWTEANKQ